jgi:hypothetical protein
MNLRRLPGRLTYEQVAAIGGFEPHQIPILVAAKLIPPLGEPPTNARKFFARDDILARVSDARWLARASDALVDHWAQRNHGKAKRKFAHQAGRSATE